MTKALVSLAVIGAALAPSAAHASSSSTCRFQHLDRGVWTQHEENVTARCVEKRWHVPGRLPKLRSVISCESGWRRLAYNPGGPYVGLAQHLLSSWASRVRAYSPRGWALSPRWQNSRTALVVTVRMVRDVGWSAWGCS